MCDNSYAPVIITLAPPEGAAVRYFTLVSCRIHQATRILNCKDIKSSQECIYQPEMLTGSIICTGNIIPKIIILYFFENVPDRIDFVLAFLFSEYVCVRADWGLGGGACGFLRFEAVS